MGNSLDPGLSPHSLSLRGRQCSKLKARRCSAINFYKENTFQRQFGLPSSLSGLTLDSLPDHVIHPGGLILPTLTGASVLKDEQFCKLRDSHERLFESIRKKVLIYTVKKYVLSELNNHPDDGVWGLYDGETPSGINVLTGSLCKHFTDSISNTLSLIVRNNCDFCNSGFSLPRNCMTRSKQDCFGFVVYLEQGLYDAD
ncbi:hypothetical protein AVEN_104339-1 [Araneus ventricosus]|uniref:Uncharacterized protein n=1 Tax=Araneus ventricosus TaxID=182803 RepID=A0A4Y2BWZ6_ARAVE|nr:hypothetical protein AVEN_104339-1 [Araneus ventricosus]